jgi:autotransporter-associated beta strand protein
MKTNSASLAILAASWLLAPASVFATSGNWNVDAGGNWSLDTNWNPVAVPGTDAGDVVGLTNNITTATRTVTIDTTSRTVGTLNIGDSDNTHTFTLAANGGATLTFDNSGGGASVAETGSVNDNITSPVILADNLTASTAGSLRITGAISESEGARTLTKSGAGTLVLSGNNNYTGGTTVNAGTLSFRNVAAKSATGTHTFDAGTTLGLGIGTGGFSSTDIQNAFADDFTGNLGGISIGSTNNIAIDTTLAAATLSANIGPSSRGLVKIEGGSNLTLNGANEYSGRTVVARGSALIVNSLGNIADASSNIGINSTIDMLEGSRIDISTSSSSDKNFNILGNSVIFPGAITFTHTGNISTETAGAKTVSFGTNDTSLTNVKDFQGVISNGSGTIAVAKVNGGNIWLSGNNTYTGATNVNAGVLIIGHANALGGTTGGTTVTNAASLGLRNGITTAAEALTLTPGGGSTGMLRNMSGNNTWSGTITTTGSATNQTSRMSSDADNLTIAGTVTITGTGNQVVLQGFGNIEITGQVTGDGFLSSATNGNGVRKLSNDSNNFTGQMRANGGTLEFTSIGNVGEGDSSLGAPATIAAGTINLGFDATEATLRYVGTAGGGHTSDRVINLNGTTGTYTLEASGTGPLVLSSDLTGTGAGNKTLVLGGTNTGNNSIAAIPNGTSGTVALTKSGAGSWILTGTNTYTGATTVNQGALLVNGSTAVGSGVTVNSGTLGGNGIIGDAVTIGDGTGSADAILAPGTGIDSLATGSLTFAADGSYSVEVDGTSATSDQTIVTGTVSIDATAALTVTVTGTLSANQKYFIVVNDDVDAISGTFAGLAQDAVVGTYGGTPLKISYTGDSVSNALTGGNDIVLYTDAGGSPYATWSGGAAPDVDTNNDGVLNGVAWVIGAAGPNTAATTLVPTLDNTSDPDFLIFNFRRSDTANADANTAIKVQYGSNLTGWTDAVAGSDIIITPDDDDYGVGIDRVEVKIRRTLAVGGKLFARLNVVVTP